MIKFNVSYDISEDDFELIKSCLLLSLDVNKDDVELINLCGRFGLL